MEISGVPLHPLVVHAVVMLVPVAVLLGWGHAFLAGWRWLTRWLALGASVAALGAVFVARQSGEDLLEKRAFLTSAQSPVRDLIETHEERADLLFIAVIAFTVVTVVAFWALPAVSGLTTGRYAHVGRDDVWLLRTVQLLSVATGLAALVYVVLTGDAGARAVWAS